MVSKRSLAQRNVIVHILGCDMEMIQQFNEPLHPYPLESLVTDELDGAYGEQPQPWENGSRSWRPTRCPAQEPSNASAGSW
jgi:uncharacterized protein (DUF2132 family)